MIFYYNRNVAHCIGYKCKLRSECYRYYLHKNVARHLKAEIFYILTQFNSTKVECKKLHIFPTL